MVMVDCNKGRGVESLYMRAVGNLYVVRTEKRQVRTEKEKKTKLLIGVNLASYNDAPSP